jgi:molecular chaperone DnaJ
MGLVDGKSLYEVLGISRNATREEIKNAYRELIKFYAPDLNMGEPERVKLQCEEKAKELNFAYEVLSDVDKRKAYDAKLDATKTCKKVTYNRTLAYVV